MTKPVSFELAKLLKEKGFDEVTRYIHSEIYGKTENINSLKHSDGNNRFVSLPTIAEVIMWLYEKHSSWIQVEAKGGRFIWRNVAVGKRFGKIAGGWSDTPIEAYEAGIKDTLENLI